MVGARCVVGQWSVPGKPFNTHPGAVSIAAKDHDVPGTGAIHRGDDDSPILLRRSSSATASARCRAGWLAMMTGLSGVRGT